MLTSLCYNGIKSGAAWKNKLERYFVSEALAFREPPEWAEAEDNDVFAEAKIGRAFSNRLSEEQALSVNA